MSHSGFSAGKKGTESLGTGTGHGMHGKQRQFHLLLQENPTYFVRNLLMISNEYSLTTAQCLVYAKPAKTDQPVIESLEEKGEGCADSLTGLNCHSHCIRWILEAKPDQQICSGESDRALHKKAVQPWYDRGGTFPFLEIPGTQPQNDRLSLG